MPTHWLTKNLTRPHFLSFLRMEAIYYPPTQTSLVLPQAFIPHEGKSVEALKRPCGRIAIYDRFDGMLCCKLIIQWTQKNGFLTKTERNKHKIRVHTKNIARLKSPLFEENICKKWKNLFCPETVPRYNALTKDLEEEELRNILNE